MQCDKACGNYDMDRKTAYMCMIVPKTGEIFRLGVFTVMERQTGKRELLFIPEEGGTKKDIGVEVFQDVYHLNYDNAKKFFRKRRGPEYKMPKELYAFFQQGNTEKNKEEKVIHIEIDGEFPKARRFERSAAWVSKQTTGGPTGKVWREDEGTTRMLATTRATSYIPVYTKQDFEEKWVKAEQNEKDRAAKKNGQGALTVNGLSLVADSDDEDQRQAPMQAVEEEDPETVGMSKADKTEYLREKARRDAVKGGFRNTQQLPHMKGAGKGKGNKGGGKGGVRAAAQAKQLEDDMARAPNVNTEFDRSKILSGENYGNVKTSVEALSKRLTAAGLADTAAGCIEEITSAVKIEKVNVRNAPTYSWIQYTNHAKCAVPLIFGIKIPVDYCKVVITRRLAHHVLENEWAEYWGVAAMVRTAWVGQS
jgi:hypothetical protein